MDTIIDFPQERRIVRHSMPIADGHSATVIILPVVRIERFDREPSDGMPAGARTSSRRRRRSRS
jgi:hypothetical protein